MEVKRVRNNAGVDAFAVRVAEWGAAVEGARRQQDPLGDDFSELAARLSGGSAAAKVDAAWRLGQQGEPAVTLLCAALKDPDYRVRAAVATSLAELGDERAIGPLAEALQDCFEGRSAMRSLWLGIGSVFGMLLLLLLLLALSLGFRCEIGLKGWWSAITEWGERRNGKTELIRVLAEALLQLGEKTESPELRRVLPDLKIVAVDVICHGRRTRKTSLEAVAWIDALTSRLRDLPLPASGDSMRSEALPYPSQPAETSTPTVPSGRA